MELVLGSLTNLNSDWDCADRCSHSGNRYLVKKLIGVYEMKSIKSVLFVIVFVLGILDILSIVVGAVLNFFKEPIGKMLSSWVEKELFGQEAEKKSDDRPTQRPSYGGSYHYKGDRSSRVSYDPYARLQKEKEVDDTYISRIEKELERVLVFESSIDAEQTLEGMMDVLNEYSIVTVDNLYALIGLETESLRDRKYGWRDLTGAKVDLKSVKKLYDTWTINFPPIISLEAHKRI